MMVKLGKNFKVNVSIMERGSVLPNFDDLSSDLQNGVFSKEFKAENIAGAMSRLLDNHRIGVINLINDEVKKPKIKIGVHDGLAHADDVLAVAIVKMWLEDLAEHCGLSNNPFKIKIVRTRDVKKLEGCDIVLDVGGVDSVDSDNGRLCFDHHQDNLAYPIELVDSAAYPNGVQFAACGKIYDVLFGAYQEPVFNRYVYENLLHPVEAQDNGCKSTERARQNLLAFVKEMAQPRDRSPEELGDVFRIMVEIASAIFSEVMNNAADAVECDTKFNDAVNMNESGDSRILILNDSFAWKSLLYKKAAEFPKLDETLFVVFPHFDGSRWNVQAVNTEPTGFELRKALPEAWRGKNGDELSNVSGIAGGVFCHKNGFIAGFQTKEQAVEAAMSAVSE